MSSDSYIEYFVNLNHIAVRTNSTTLRPIDKLKQNSNTFLLLSNQQHMNTPQLYANTNTLEMSSVSNTWTVICSSMRGLYTN